MKLARWAAFALLAAAAACATPIAERARFDPETYLIGPGDTLRVEVFGEAELTGEYAVGADGVIELPVIGPMPAACMIAEDFAESFRALLPGYLRQANVAVRVAAYRIYSISGVVAAPGAYPFTPGLTVLDAVAAAGGVSAGARGARSAFISPPCENRERRYGLDAPIHPGDAVRIASRSW